MLGHERDCVSSRVTHGEERKKRSKKPRSGPQHTREGGSQRRSRSIHRATGDGHAREQREGSMYTEHRARAQEDGAQRGNSGGADEGETRSVPKRGDEHENYK